MVLLFELVAAIGIIGYFTALLNGTALLDLAGGNNDDVDPFADAGEHADRADNVVLFTPKIDAAGRFRCNYLGRNRHCTAGLLRPGFCADCKLGAGGTCIVTTEQPTGVAK